MTMTPTDNPKSNYGESTTIKQTPASASTIVRDCA